MKSHHSSVILIKIQFCPLGENTVHLTIIIQLDYANTILFASVVTPWFLSLLGWKKNINFAHYLDNAVSLILASVLLLAQFRYNGSGVLASFLWLFSILLA